MIDVLTFGSKHDPHVSRIISRLESRGLGCEVINVMEPPNVVVTYEDKVGPQFVVNGKSVTNNTLLWDRSKLFWGSLAYFTTDKSDYSDDDIRHFEYIAAEWRGLFGVLSLIFSEQNLLNPITSKGAPTVKMLQQQVAAAVGFKTPPTLVTTSREHAIKFLENYPQSIIKSFAGAYMRNKRGQLPLQTVTTTTAITTEDLIAAAEHQFSACPHMLQMSIPKKYEIRVVAIDGTMFAFRINSQDKEYTITDWRPGILNLDFQPMALPREIEEKLTKFLKYYGFDHGSVDLIVDHSDEYWFLECNPNGAWAWLDDICNGRIADEFCNYILKSLNKLRARVARPTYLEALKQISQTHAFSDCLA